MFTGIVAAVGSIKSVTPLADGADAGVRLAIDAGGLPLADVALGDSIAINGACMTVVEKSDTAFAVDVSRESLNRTVGLDQPGEVNLEKALTLAERLGGHLVSGHVDGLGEVHSFGQVGDGGTVTRPVPTQVVGGVTFAAIHTGTESSCGRASSGMAYCWGRNDTGAVGDGTLTARLKPVGPVKP